MVLLVSCSVRRCPLSFIHSKSRNLKQTKFKITSVKGTPFPKTPFSGWRRVRHSLFTIACILRNNTHCDTIFNQIFRNRNRVRFRHFFGKGKPISENSRSVRFALRIHRNPNLTQDFIRWSVHFALSFLARLDVLGLALFIRGKLFYFPVFSRE